MKLTRAFALSSIAVFAACGSKQQEAPVAAAPVPVETAPAPVEPTPPPPPPAPVPVVAFADMASPESVIYDEANDVYLVSNMNGGPTDIDNNGFISKLSPDGTVIAAKWIEGGKNKVTLNAPHGAAIANGMLYVSDVDTVRMFDMKTGAPKGAIAIKGATFLNDMAASADGKVYVADTGVAFKDGEIVKTGTDAVYVIDKKKKVTALAKSVDLGGPNGLIVADGKLWVASMNSGELYWLDTAKPSAKADAQTMPKGMLDGLVVTPAGVLVSSWEAQAVLKGAPGGEFVVLLDQLEGPADIGYDSKRNRVLVPRMTKNTLDVYSIE